MASYSAHTSGNVKFNPGMLELDYIIVSVDGARQESYEQYRVGGKFEMSIDFMRELLAARRAFSNRFSKRRFRELLALPDERIRHYFKLPRRLLRYAIRKRPHAPLLPVVQWKYILFEHNDSDEEITLAQRMAGELGVDEMQFVLSHTSNRSRRFTTEEQIAEDPLFHQFSKDSVVGSTVNDAIDNITLWEDDDHRIAATR